VPIRSAKETDSITKKAIYFVTNNSIEIASINDDQIIAKVKGLHIDDTELKDSYIVIIRNDGSHTCTCLGFVHSKKEYMQFWGDIPKRTTPECSHVTAIKLTSFYRKWISKDNNEIHNINLNLKSFVHTSGVQIAPSNLLSLHNGKRLRRKRLVSFEKLTCGNDE